MSLDTAVKQCVDDIDTEAKAMQSKCEGEERKMEDHANSKVEDVPWYRIDKHIAMWWQETMTKLWEKFTEFLNKVYEFAKWLGDQILKWIFAPFYIAQSWVKWQVVAEKVSTTQGKMSLNHVQGAVEWKGAAAKAYETTATEQEKAGEATVKLIIALQNLLKSHLEQMLDLLMKLLASLTSMAIAVTESVAKFIKIVDPLEWGDIVDGLIGVVTTAMSEAQKVRESIVEYFRGHISEMGNVLQNTLPAYSLPGGKMWPDPSPNVNPVDHPGKPWQPNR